MGLKENIINTIQSPLKKLAYHVKSDKKPLNVVFLIGCGRSGTTILGHTIGSHPEIAYLNERRDLWHKAYPDFNIWSDVSSSAKLYASSTDNSEIETNLLKTNFHREQVFRGASMTLEKLPINNFRLEFLQTAFPDAKFIYLHRNAIRVAESISKLVPPPGLWYGEDNKKWKLMVEYAMTKGFTIPATTTAFEKGLIEWQLSVSQSEKFFDQIEDSSYYALSYDSFIENPKLYLGDIYNFLDLSFDDDFLEKFTANIKVYKRESLPELTQTQTELAGPFLESSIRNHMRHSRKQHND